jgi:transposase InsO family protein
MFTAAIQPSRLCVPVYDRLSHLWALQRRRWRALASSPSLHRHPTTQCPHRRTANTSSEHSWDQHLSCGSRSNRFQAPRSPSTVTHLPGYLGRMFQLLYGSKCSSPDLSHPGTKAAASLVAQHFVWPGVQDCRTCARTCQAGQRSKVSRHTVTPVGDFTMPATRFLHVHTDLDGTLPKSAGYTYCLTAADCLTRWPEAILIPDSTADTAVWALFTGWISRFRCPQTITTDQGRQSESQLFHTLAKLCGIQPSRTTVHHTAANELVERFHRTMKASLMCHEDKQWT